MLEIVKINRLLSIKYLGLVAVFVSIMTTSSCIKEPFGKIDTFLGTWQVVSLQTQTYDTNGNKISDVTKTDIGDAEIVADPDNKGNFNPILFDPKMAAFKPISTIIGLGAGGQGTNGRRFVYFSPDIDNERINFWGIGPSTSISDMATVVKYANNELKLAAVDNFPASANNTSTPTLQTMYTLILKKR